MTAADYVLVESTYGGREHEPEGGGDPDPRRDGADGRRGGRRAARPVVRDRADAGGRLGARPAHRARRDPAAAALPRLADGLEGVGHLPAPSRTTTTRRPRSCCATARRRSTTRTRSSRNDVKAVAGDRAGAAAVHDRGLERDADRRPGRRPPAQPHRRPDGDDPVRRLPGRGDARRAPPGRRDDRQARRPGPARSAARSAPSAGSRRTPTRASCSTGSSGFAAGKQPGDPGYPRRVFLVHGDPEAQIALEPKVRDLGLRHPRPALARARHAGLTSRRRDRRPASTAETDGTRPSVSGVGTTSDPGGDHRDANAPSTARAQRRADRRSRRLLELGRQQRAVGRGPVRGGPVGRGAAAAAATVALADSRSARSSSTPRARRSTCSRRTRAARPSCYDDCADELAGARGDRAPRPPVTA